MRHIVDCNLDPRPRHGYRITGDGAEHQKMGKVELQLRGDSLYANGAELVLHEFSLIGDALLALSDRSPALKTTAIVELQRFRKELRDAQCMNACMMDYLADHQELIPKSWERREPSSIFFLGTVFRMEPCTNSSSEDNLYVPSMMYMNWGPEDPNEKDWRPFWSPGLTSFGVRCYTYSPALVREA